MFDDLLLVLNTIMNSLFLPSECTTAPITLKLQHRAHQLVRRNISALDLSRALRALDINLKAALEVLFQVFPLVLHLAVLTRLFTLWAFR